MFERIWFGHPNSGNLFYYLEETGPFSNVHIIEIFLYCSADSGIIVSNASKS